MATQSAEQHQLDRLAGNMEAVLDLPELRKTIRAEENKAQSAVDLPQPIVTRRYGLADSWTLRTYLDNGGYEGLRKAKLTLATTNLIKFDPLRLVRMPSGEFVQLLRQHSEGDVIVSLLGPPVLESQCALGKRSRREHLLLR